jgi:subtilisin family serine protease
LIAGLTGAVLSGQATDSTAQAQVALPPLKEPLHRPLDPALERIDNGLDNGLGSRIERRAREMDEKAEESPVDDAAKQAGTALDHATDAVQSAGERIDAVVDTAGSAAGQAARETSGVVSLALRPFALAADPAGWPVEQDMLVVLLDEQQLESLGRQGLEIVARRDLPSLGLTMATVRKAAGATLPQTIRDLRAALPDVAADFNHIYRYAADGGTDLAPADGQVAPEDDGSPPAASGMRVGMIDSAVMAEHFSLRGSAIVSEDFVTHEGTRPLGHGTAVASLIARSASNEAKIYAASVFFQTSNHAPGATTESLVGALDWLASEKVDVINMSLAGPGNALLERALAAITTTAEESPAIVAAVGNNGPSGEPLYPAAYPDVIGVTAVDREERIFRYANRGDHVDFAALGVDLKVADNGAGWRIESGTSMASPHVAVVVARMLHPERMAHDALVSALTASAEDLGREGFDPVFGHGLLTAPPLLVSGQ